MMTTFTLQKAAILVATLAIGSTAVAGNALAASNHTHPQSHKSANMKMDCKAMSWEIPTQTQGTPETAVPCARYGVK